MEVKICKKCGEEKGLECFNTAKQNKDGLTAECKTCVNTYNKQYAKKNAEKIAAKNKQWREANAEKLAEQRKQYRKSNPEKISAINKQYYKENTEKIVERAKQYYKDNFEKISEYSKLYREAHAEKVSEYSRSYYKDNAEQFATNGKLYYEAHAEQFATRSKQYRETHAEQISEYKKLYNKANPEKYRLTNQRRRTMKKSLISDFTFEQWESCLSYFEYKDAYTGLPLNSPTQDHVVPLSKGGGYTIRNIVPCNHNINSSKGNRDMLTWFRKQPYYDSEREKKILTYLDEVPSGFNTRKRQGVKSNEYSRTL